MEPAAAKDLVFKVREALPENMICVVGSVYNLSLIHIYLAEAVLLGLGLLTAGNADDQIQQVVRGLVRCV